MANVTDDPEVAAMASAMQLVQERAYEDARRAVMFAYAGILAKLGVTSVEMTPLEMIEANTDYTVNSGFRENENYFVELVPRVRDARQADMPFGEK